MRTKYVSLGFILLSFSPISCFILLLLLTLADRLQLLDAIEDELLQGGYLIDWHACDLFPKSWIDLIVVLRCPSTSTLYDRLSSRYLSISNITPYTACFHAIHYPSPFEWKT